MNSKNYLGNEGNRWYADQSLKKCLDFLLYHCTLLCLSWCAQWTEGIKIIKYMRAEMGFHNSMNNLRQISWHKISRLRIELLTILQFTKGNVLPYCLSDILIYPGFQQSMNCSLSIKFHFLCCIFLIYFILWVTLTWLTCAWHLVFSCFFYADKIII